MLLTVDTLSFAANFECENDLFDFLQLDRSIFEFSYASQQNYEYSYYFQGIILSFGGKSNWKCYIHMSGKGCRAFEDLRGDHFSWDQFLKDVCNQIVSFRRIDIAADDTVGVLTFDKVEKAFRQNKIAGKLRTYKCITGAEKCFYAGSNKSSCLIRIYDKALERGYSEEELGHPWTRCEMQLRDPYCGQFIF